MLPYAPITALASVYSLPVSFFARRTHFIDHLAPIWHAMSRKGTFYVPEHLIAHAIKQGIDAVGLSAGKKNPLNVSPPGREPFVTCAYGDMERIFTKDCRRPLILMEHGVGLTFDHPGYAGGVGTRRRVHLFLAPNEYIAAKTRKTLPTAPQVVIGTPKLDKYANYTPCGCEKKIVTISFHWDGKRVAAEAGNAFEYYKDSLFALSTKFCMVGHGHPKIIEKLRPVYEENGIHKTEPNFDLIMENAAVYVNDASSTLYEFCVTGKPVVILNAPWFDREVNHGIRFWDYTDIGIQVNYPSELVGAIQRTLDNPEEFAPQRQKMVSELYPYLGSSAQRAADAIEAFCEDKAKNVRSTFSFA